MSLKKAKEFLGGLEDNISVLILAAILVILTMQVILRFVPFFNSNSWSEELSRYLFIWMGYLTACTCVGNNSHIRIDTLIHVWPKKIRPAIMIFGNIIFFIYCIVVTYFGGVYTASIASARQISLGLGVSMWLIYLTVPLCHAVMAFRLVVLTVKMLREPERYLKENSPEEEAAAATGSANLN